MATLRIYVTGRVSIENGQKLVDERALGGRQGRLAFAFLASERQRPITKEELTSVIWTDGPPREVESALAAILSKLRGALKNVAGASAIEVRTGTIQMRLPYDVWIDLEYAANALDEAEGALRAGNTRAAWAHAVGLVIIARRCFLAGDEAPWIEARRAKLRAVLVRGLYVLSKASALNDEDTLAVQYASEIVDLEPFQETGYRDLMRMHAQMGNRGEALRVFGRCRELFKEELGAHPSQETERVFLEILRAGS